jgi:predicted phage terminase large subunit-like protein
MRLAWPIVQPSFTLSLNWHHGIMCRGLEALLRGAPEAERVNCNVPPGSTKSLLTSVFFPAYTWGPGKRPEWRQLFGSFDASLTLRDSNYCKDLMRSDWYQRRWGFKADPTMLRRYGLVPVQAGKDDSAQSDSASIWWTSGGGLRFATSVGSKATGWHFHAAFVDDPTKPKTIQNGGDQARVALKGTEEWWGSTIASRRLNPNYFGRWVVMQRLHTEDLSAYAQRQGYTSIVVPARHDPERPCSSPWGDDPRTEKGEIFWAERFSDAGLADLEKALGAHANAQYQQDPIPDGGAIFRPEWFVQFYRALPAGIDKWTQSWDCTFSGSKTSDFVAGQVWARKGSNHYLCPVRVKARMGLPATIQAMKGLTDQYPRAVRKLVENKANGPAVAQSLEGKLPGIVLVEPEGGKVSRAHEATVYFEAGNVWLPHPDIAPWITEYIAEFLAFPQGANDDEVDATTQYLNDANPGKGDRLSRLAKAVRG